MLKISHVNTFYGRIQALWDISMTVEKGTIYALIGSNGAGKTTLLKTISGWLPCSENHLVYHLLSPMRLSKIAWILRAYRLRKIYPLKN